MEKEKTHGEDRERKEIVEQINNQLAHLGALQDGWNNSHEWDPPLVAVAPNKVALQNAHAMVEKAVEHNTLPNLIAADESELDGAVTLSFTAGSGGRVLEMSLNCYNDGSIQLWVLDTRDLADVLKGVPNPSRWAFQIYKQKTGKEGFIMLDLFTNQLSEHRITTDELFARMKTLLQQT